ncbi:MAG: arylamine N-acetyltransferase [Candidatus Eisenbacteria bacterium]|uniref:Arylamine N-acetyltransferase n=1 Tax=Eiseniibacteriota bacterium TaxID=2212470 RepID=A0A948W8G8_UNCEI|nr:arylamine N-acetyltransferase [Candidatus Eisenbacteria bacterium]MBU1950451.1 arylamine N-acetyltransferase [Candidatus Eisenbacteria bacterium]MBU2692681.1 arylamine N-acetyltransferase [Candidatus Eisenbacteria bacterium]
MTQISKTSAIFIDLYNIRPKTPDLHLLGEVSHQFANLPWENLTKFIKKHQPANPHRPGSDAQILPPSETAPLRRSEEVIGDHALVGTGGTCFSLTNALRRITGDLGFKTYPVMADMKHGANIHCALMVELGDRRFLLDPGYLVPEPISLNSARATTIRLPGYRLEYRPVNQGKEIGLYMVNDRGEETYRYRLRPWGIPEENFIQFWIQSFETSGMNQLHLNRVTSDARLSAHGMNLRVDTGRDKENVKLRGSYAEQIAARFGISQKIAQCAVEEWERQQCRK